MYAVVWPPLQTIKYFCYFKISLTSLCGQSLSSPSNPIVLCFPKCHVSGTQCLDFCLLFFAFHNVFQIQSMCTSILLLLNTSGIPVWEYITVCLWMNSGFQIKSVMNTNTWHLSARIYGNMFSFVSGKYLGVKFVGIILSICLILWKLFSNKMYYFFIVTSNVCKCQSWLINSSLCFQGFGFFLTSHMGM